MQKPNSNTGYLLDSQKSESRQIQEVIWFTLNCNWFQSFGRIDYFIFGVSHRLEVIRWMLFSLPFTPQINIVNQDYLIMIWVERKIENSILPCAFVLYPVPILDVIWLTFLSYILSSILAYLLELTQELLPCGSHHWKLKRNWLHGRKILRSFGGLNTLINPPV